MLELWEMQSTHPFIAIAPWSTLTRSGSAWWGHIYGWNRLKSVQMLNWIVWNRTVLTLKLCTYAKLNCLKYKGFFLHWNCVHILNWIVWNRTVFYTETVYIYLTELFGVELFLALNVCTYAKLNWKNLSWGENPENGILRRYAITSTIYNSDGVTQPHTWEMHK